MALIILHAFATFEAVISRQSASDESFYCQTAALLRILLSCIELVCLVIYTHLFQTFDFVSPSWQRMRRLSYIC